MANKPINYKALVKKTDPKNAQSPPTVNPGPSPITEEIRKDAVKTEHDIASVNPKGATQVADSKSMSFTGILRELEKNAENQPAEHTVATEKQTVKHGKAVEGGDKKEGTHIDTDPHDFVRRYNAVYAPVHDFFEHWKADGLLTELGISKVNVDLAVQTDGRVSATIASIEFYDFKNETAKSRETAVPEKPPESIKRMIEDGLRSRIPEEFGSPPKDKKVQYTYVADGISTIIQNDKYVAGGFVKVGIDHVINSLGEKLGAENITDVTVSLIFRKSQSDPVLIKDITPPAARDILLNDLRQKLGGYVNNGDINPLKFENSLIWTYQRKIVLEKQRQPPKKEGISVIENLPEAEIQHTAHPEPPFLRTEYKETTQGRAVINVYMTDPKSGEEKQYSSIDIRRKDKLGQISVLQLEDGSKILAEDGKPLLNEKGEPIFVKKAEAEKAEKKEEKKDEPTIKEAETVEPLVKKKEKPKPEEAKKEKPSFMQEWGATIVGATAVGMLGVLLFDEPVKWLAAHINGLAIPKEILLSDKLTVNTIDFVKALAAATFVGNAINVLWGYSNKKKEGENK